MGPRKPSAGDEWGGEGSCFLDFQDWEGDGQGDCPGNSPGDSVLRCWRVYEWYPKDNNPAMASLWLAPATPGRMLRGKAWARKASGLVTRELSREGVEVTRRAREGVTTQTGGP